MTPSWRWVFYLGAPFALLAAVYTWATARGWPEPVGGGRHRRRRRRAVHHGVPSGLIALTSAGGNDATISIALAVTSVVALVAAVLWFRRARTHSSNLDYFRDRTFSGAVAMAVLTGYAFATAIIGAAVFIDRVRYAGPSEQQLALGSLAGAMAIGALGSGYLVRPMGVMLPEPRPGSSRRSAAC